MKILSVILSFYIIALNAQPIVDMIDWRCESTCLSIVHDSADLDDKKPAENDENGCNDLCNPFMSCSTCLGCTIPTVILFSDQLGNNEIQLTFYQGLNSRQYSDPIWQPPPEIG